MVAQDQRRPVAAAAPGPTVGAPLASRCSQTRPPRIAAETAP